MRETEEIETSRYRLFICALRGFLKVNSHSRLFGGYGYARLVREDDIPRGHQRRVTDFALRRSIDIRPNDRALADNVHPLFFPFAGVAATFQRSLRVEFSPAEERSFLPAGSGDHVCSD